jgi:DNA-directed RNA polymerase sigma subunit (sigma70/sigma32)
MSIEDVRAAWETLEAARKTEREAREDLSKALRDARPEHTLQELSQVLGVSRQRIDQLSREKT